ncbi:uncharacterized protein LOC114274890 [Camellia sinensis]|uniref:uncharacterized protein LOC114274890 n=1 Tax=Camellia sinensis TaxID=4442 RepID=UPI0010368585|nr:uncharacterized protein LOC114274890 [Camellia sinensis]
MVEKDAENTAFRTPLGNFFYTVVPFGLQNAGATYERAMTAIFHNMIHHEVEDYVDDLVVKSKKEEDHLRDLEKVFKRCQKFKMRMNPLKCAFGVMARKFLGFLVYRHGIKADEEKVKSIRAMPLPHSQKELKSFLGKVSYIQRSDLIRYLLSKPALTGKVARWLLALGEFKITCVAPKAIKSQALTDLLVQFSSGDYEPVNEQLREEVHATMVSEESFWTLSFDGAEARGKGGTGIILTSKSGKKLYLSYKLDFHCSNNEVEYKALILVLKVAEKHNIKKIWIQGDSKLIMKQIECPKYQSYIREDESCFEIDTPDWRQVYVDYLKEGTLPENPKDIAHLKRRVRRYFLNQNRLYRRSIEGTPLRCLSKEESNLVLERAHDIEHQEGAQLFEQLIHLGYYWSTM